MLDFGTYFLRYVTVVFQRIGILFQTRIARAESIAATAASFLEKLGVSCWRHSSWDDMVPEETLRSTDAVISVGGDGTILRVARSVAPWSIPIIGVNLGRLGFMTEIELEEMESQFSRFLNGEGWIEERAMLSVHKDGDSFFEHALNDVVVSREGPAQMIRVEVAVDDHVLRTWWGDGFIVATATGSTGYSLALGGPILPPTSSQLILKPISPHLAPITPIVLSEGSCVSLRIGTRHPAALSVDGQIDYPIGHGDLIHVTSSPFRTRFLRLRPATYFHDLIGDVLSGVRAHQEI